MALSKSSTTLLASQSLGAGASVNVTELDLTGKNAAHIFVKITNGSPAPTTPPTVIFYAGEASGVKREIARGAGDITASSVNHPNCRYSLANMFANVTITNGATNAITVEVYAQTASL